MSGPSKRKFENKLGQGVRPGKDDREVAGWIGLIRGWCDGPNGYGPR